MIHRLMDAVAARSSKVIVYDWAAADNLMALASKAEKFDFGELHLEDSGSRSKIDGSVEWSTPKLTADEEKFLDDGLVPLPASICWYEFSLGGHTSGLLVKLTDGKWLVTRLDFDRGPGTGVVLNIWIRKTDEGMEVFGDPELISDWYAHGELEHEGANFRLSRYLTLMLGSKTTDVVVVPAKKKTSLSGKTPLPEHRVVTIVPKRFICNGSGQGTHASPRLHWRRSHLREYRAPSGEVYHRVVIPRVLVGRAELGEVSHEYRIKQ